MLKRFFVSAMKRNVQALCDRLYKNPRILKANRKKDEISIEIYHSLSMSEEDKAIVEKLCDSYDTIIHILRDIMPKYYYAQGVRDGLSLQKDMEKGGVSNGLRRVS